MDRLDKLRSCIKPNSQGIEIAPWHSPVAPKSGGFNTLIVDLFDHNALITNAKNFGIAKEKHRLIEEPDYVGDASNLLKLLREQGFTDQVDWIISSHNFEHLPDPIKFMQDCSRLLEPDGILTMAVPDKRFCFDRFHSSTTTANVIRESMDDSSHHPNAWAKFTQQTMRAEMQNNDGTRCITWSLTDNTPELLVTKDNIREQYDVLMKSLTTGDSEAFSGHRWHFTPASFQLIILDLQVLGLINLGIKKIWDTVGCEFIVQLHVTEKINPSEDEYKIERTKLLLRAEDELAAVSRAYLNLQRDLSQARSFNEMQSSTVPQSLVPHEMKVNSTVPSSAEIDAATACKRLLYLSGSPSSIGHYYRVVQQMEVMDYLGYEVHELDSAIDYQTASLDGYDAIVLFRYAHDEKLEKLIQRCEALGIVTIFDIDDLVFIPELMNEKTWDYLRTADDKWREQWMMTINRYATTLSRCDAAILSTESLRKHAESLGKPGYVLPNGIGNFMLAASDRVLGYGSCKLSEFDGQIRMGYASGSPTHQKDFSEIAPVIYRLLERYDNIILIIIGHLRLNEFPMLNQYRDRIEMRSRVDHMELFREYSRFDINLAPLQSDNPFCECKSQLKYHEAALVEVPTVASATQPYIDSIEHGVTGFIASTEDDWMEYLNCLITDNKRRATIGKKAREHVIKTFGVEEQSRIASEIFSDLLIN